MQHQVILSDYRACCRQTPTAAPTDLPTSTPTPSPTSVRHFLGPGAMMMMMMMTLMMVVVVLLVQALACSLIRCGCV
jgi:hypothetical protein